MNAVRWIEEAGGRAFIRRGTNAVTVTRAGVSAFAKRWPCSGFPDKPVTFVFDRGDLVDVLPYSWGPDADGAAVAALTEDCRELLTPEVAPEAKP